MRYLDNVPAFSPFGFVECPIVSVAHISQTFGIQRKCLWADKILSFKSFNLLIPILYEDTQNIKRTAKYAKSAKNRELLI